jgi:hypothetical protein
MSESTSQAKLTFSQRMGFAEVRTAIQKDNLDKETRTALWNLIGPFLEKRGRVSGLFHDYWFDYRKGEYEQERDDYWFECHNLLISVPFYEVFDFVEFLVKEKNRKKWNKKLKQQGYSERVPTADAFNDIFKRYLVGYRVIDGQIVPITAEEEIQAVKECQAKSPDCVREQMEKALRFLSNREKPDYAQSVHCSISAVESQCNILLGGKKLSLGQALDELDKQGFHWSPTLKAAFKKLYGFASDAPGIRHGGVKPSDADQPLAIFLLVSSSAFVNYLRANSVDTDKVLCASPGNEERHDGEEIVRGDACGREAEDETKS